MNKKIQILKWAVPAIVLGGIFIGIYQIKNPAEREKPLSSQNNTNTPQKEDTSSINKPIQTFIALGDSLTEGYRLHLQFAYPHLLETRLNKKFPQYKTKVINDGISGSTTSSGVTRLKRHLHLKPRAVLITLGSNDGLRGIPIDSIRKNLQDMIDLALNNNIAVLLAGLKLPINYGESYREPFEQIFKDLSKENNIIYIPFLLEGVAGQPAFNLPDLIHPNEEGHKIITQTLYPYFRKFYE